MLDLTTDSISGFHAHIYYDASTKEKAQQLREKLAQNFTEIKLGRWHDRPIGPHPRWSYQVAFEKELFGKLIPWLMLHQNGLIILVHPLTGDDLADHRDYAIWLGEKLELNLEVLKQ
ncbi:DOPA 4,5-dioxygenase family protein [Gloeothece verrucosa]|uniref:Dopa 45-dioxygenase n=1 Tax=Gloeothece verrucosa (strain PCC 7822) TaxID=497965 RepID=E0UKH9_GLOV7|nr:DOPA 4,5-dioxygenase family protein [Gloeothece verrucosa]ADN17060.1 Dopa 45-dioxygenase [Gloeothece verrucosa PCC 7822]